MPNSRARKSSRCGASAISSSDSSFAAGDAGTRGQQPVAQRGVGLRQELQERGVDARKPVARVEVFEGKVEAQAKHRQVREL